MAKHRHINILVVEDNVDDVYLVKRFFRDQVRIANDVDYVTTLEEARELLKSNTFDIIFCDLSLPDGDGFELIATIDTSICPIVILTGLITDTVKRKAAYLGASLVMEKPLSEVKFNEAMRIADVWNLLVKKEDVA